MSELSTICPLILTLKLDSETFGFFDPLRQKHFPPERNFLSAHITLFHALPGEEESQIQSFLADLCSHTSVLPLAFPKLRFLGKGVAVDIESVPLIRLRQALAQEWSEWLSRQDQQGYRPHITIQNKVSAEQAKQLHQELSQTWQPLSGWGEGLLLWYYQGGPWSLAGEFSFRR